MLDHRVVAPARAVLVAVTVLSAVTAVGGGVAMVVTDGLGMPERYLDGTPFDSFVGPGLLLAVVVGGTQTVAAVLLLGRRASALVWSAVAGVTMQAWIFGELAVIGEVSWLQLVYFASGTLQLALVTVLMDAVLALERRAGLQVPARRRQGTS